MPYQVYGAIGDRYNALGGAGSWLGQPTADERPFVDGGRISTFERGSIYWWPDTPAIDMANVSVRFKGLYCFSTTSGFGADEPYVTFGVAPPPPGQGSSVRSPIYEDVDGGDSRPDSIELYRGLPYGMQLQCGLWEHDAGDQDQVAQAFKELADVAAQKGVEACAGQTGPQVAELCKGAWDGYVRDLAGSLLDEILGVGDDKISTWSWNVSAKDMVRHCWMAPTDFWGIGYHVESGLQSGDGADYKVYLDFTAV